MCDENLKFDKSCDHMTRLCDRFNKQRGRFNQNHYNLHVLQHDKQIDGDVVAFMFLN